MNIEKERRAIEYLKAFQPESESYYLCYSGGKDSDVILTLAKLAGVNFEAVHNLTTVDAPETVKYVRSNPDVRINPPEKTMWQLIVEKRMPPTRRVRYCCEHLKEHGGKGRVKITGVRRDESRSRKENGGIVKVLGKEKTMRRLAEEAGLDYDATPKGGLVMNDDNADTRRFVEMCYRTTSTMINPIVDWTTDDVWEYLHHYGNRSNPLYQVISNGCTFCPRGNRRIGCLVCPMQRAAGMKADLINYPIYRDNYLRSFKRMQEKRVADGLLPFGSDQYGGMTPEEIMMWWVEDDPRQLSLFGVPEYLKGACLR